MSTSFIYTPYVQITEMGTTSCGLSKNCVNSEITRGGQIFQSQNKSDLRRLSTKNVWKVVAKLWYVTYYGCD